MNPMDESASAGGYTTKQSIPPKPVKFKDESDNSYHIRLLKWDDNYIASFNELRIRDYQERLDLRKKKSKKS